MLSSAYTEQKASDWHYLIKWFKILDFYQGNVLLCAAMLTIAMQLVHLRAIDNITMNDIVLNSGVSRQLFNWVQVIESNCTGGYIL